MVAVEETKVSRRRLRSCQRGGQRSGVATAEVCQVLSAADSGVEGLLTACGGQPRSPVARCSHKAREACAFKKRAGRRRVELCQPVTRLNEEGETGEDACAVGGFGGEGMWRRGIGERANTRS